MIRNAVDRGNEVLHLGGFVVEEFQGKISEKVYEFLLNRRKNLDLLVKKLAEKGIFSEFKEETKKPPKTDDKKTKERDVENGN
jgi:hypothetical protein